MDYAVSARLGAALVAFGLAVSPAFAEGDAAKGKKVFNKCKSCHVADEEKNKIGPHLVNLFGRAAGSLEGYKYSDAMKSSGLVWDDETLAQYLAKPRDFVPGTKMAFAGLKKQDQVEDLLAYLKDVTQK